MCGRLWLGWAWWVLITMQSCVIIVFLMKIIASKKILISTPSVFTAPVCKISGLKDALTCPQMVYIFSGTVTLTFSAMCFDENPFTYHCYQCEKEWTGVRVSNLAVLLVVFKWTSAVKGLRVSLQLAGYPAVFHWMFFYYLVEVKFKSKRGFMFRATARLSRLSVRGNKN